MMAGNPNWWSMHPQSHQFVCVSSNSSAADDDHDHLNQDFPVRSWSQLLLGGEEDRYGASLFQQQKKLENWEDDQVLLNLNNPFNFTRIINNPHHPNTPSNNSSNWLSSHHQNTQVSSPTSCITTTSFSNNVLNFSGGHKTSAALVEGKNQRHNQDHSSECNSTSTGGESKKPRVQHSSAQPALKTDTASVLSEAIGYIRFLEGQIEALSSPYMRNAPGNSTIHSEYSVVQDTERQEGIKDLRIKGLCLVPISCTQNVENENGADYWPPGGGF